MGPVLRPGLALFLRHKRGFFSVMNGDIDFVLVVSSENFAHISLGIFLRHFWDFFIDTNIPWS